MIIIDVYPLKGFFLPDEQPSFRLLLQADQTQSVELHLSVYAMQTRCYEFTLKLTCAPGEQSLCLALPAEANLSCGGYALCLSYDVKQVWTAFDVQQSWLDFPRYGFLSDFSTALDEPGLIEARLENLAKFHLNGLQFYDWQYRHDQLVAPTDQYLDPLKRPLSLHTIRRLIAAAHLVNLAAMPYLAIYGASIEFWRQHPDWGMYTREGKPLLFEDFLGLMNPASGSSWAAHLADQCWQTLAALPFDGLHIDQYGDPKQAFTSTGDEIDLPEAFVGFIDARKHDLQVPVIFNAVGNWPIEALAKSQADMMYIEVWPPTPRFTDIQQIVENARSLSGGKPVVIPIYIPAVNKTNLLLADAVIAASGGTHLELGDDLKLLSDPYFPKSETLPEDYQLELRRYWDFITAYQALIGPQAENIELSATLPYGVHGITRGNGSLLALNLIQFSPEDCWTEAQAVRTCFMDMPVSVEVQFEVKGVWWASPDLLRWQWQPLEYQQQGKMLICNLPALIHWSTILIEFTN
jgi:dextranase